MIKYKRNIIAMLAEKGLTTYVIRQNKIFTEGQLQQLRTDKLVTQDTLDKLCASRAFCWNMFQMKILKKLRKTY